MPRAFWPQSVVHAPGDRRTDIHGADDPTRHEKPRHMRQKTVWDFSPTRKKIKNINRFIKGVVLMVLNTLPIYGRLNTHYIYYVNK